jgi:outer membrane cobalamin receptor
MFSPLFRLRALALSLACGVVLSPSFAQTDAQRVTVTAARVEQPLADALPSTRVIGRGEI